VTRAMAHAPFTVLHCRIRSMMSRLRGDN
jgi:hypothetical protein